MAENWMDLNNKNIFVDYSLLVHIGFKSKKTWNLPEPRFLYFFTAGYRALRKYL